MFNQGTGHRHMRNKQFYVVEGGFGERLRKPQVLGKSKVKEIMIKEKLGLKRGSIFLDNSEPQADSEGCVGAAG